MRVRQKALLGLSRILFNATKILSEHKSKGVDTWAKEPKYVDLHNMIYECEILSRIARPKFISLRNVVTIELRRNFNNKDTYSFLFVCFRCDYEK